MSRGELGTTQAEGAHVLAIEPRIKRREPPVSAAASFVLPAASFDL